MKLLAVGPLRAPAHFAPSHPRMKITHIVCQILRIECPVDILIASLLDFDDRVRCQLV